MARKQLDKTLNSDMGEQIANIDEMLEELFNAPGAPGADYSDLVVTTANGSDAASTQALANDLKVKFNSLVARLSGD